MMKAMILERFGAPPALRTVPRPAPGPGEVLVQVAASGVNPLDLKIIDGAAAHAQVTPPHILGLDLAGVVAELGEGVRAFQVGDEVYGLGGGVGTVPGSLAEYAAVDADILAAKPARLSLAEAAALPLAAITAWEGLVDRAAVGPGQRVLVQGGAGGVGHVAVQLALALGASVFATGTGDSLALIKQLGAVPIDYRVTPPAELLGPATGGEGFDVIFDTVGGGALDDAFAMVRRYTGRVVSILGWSTHSLAPLSFRGASYSGVFTLLPLLTGEGRAHHGEILRSVADLVDAERITPVLDQRCYQLDTASAAHKAVADGTARGKVVVRVTP